MEKHDLRNHRQGRRKYLRRSILMPPAIRDFVLAVRACATCIRDRAKPVTDLPAANMRELICCVEGCHRLTESLKLECNIVLPSVRSATSCLTAVSPPAAVPPGQPDAFLDPHTSPSNRGTSASQCRFR